MFARRIYICTLPSFMHPLQFSLSQACVHHCAGHSMWMCRRAAQPFRTRAFALLVALLAATTCARALLQPVLRPMANGERNSHTITVVQQNGDASFVLPLQLVPRVGGEVVESVTILEADEDILTSYTLSPFTVAPDGSTKLDVDLRFSGLPGETVFAVEVGTSVGAVYAIRPAFEVLGIAIYKKIRGDNGKLRMYTGPDAEILRIPVRGVIEEVAARTFAGTSGISRAVLRFHSDVSTLPWDDDGCDSIVNLELEAACNCSVSFKSPKTDVFQIRSLADEAPEANAPPSTLDVVWFGVADALKIEGLGNQITDLKDPRVSIQVQEIDLDGANHCVTMTGIWCTIVAFLLLFCSVSCYLYACKSADIDSSSASSFESSGEQMEEPPKDGDTADKASSNNTDGVYRQWGIAGRDEEDPQLSSPTTSFPVTKYARAPGIARNALTGTTSTYTMSDPYTSTGTTVGSRVSNQFALLEQQEQFQRADGEVVTNLMPISSPTKGRGELEDHAATNVEQATTPSSALVPATTNLGPTMNRIPFLGARNSPRRRAALEKFMPVTTSEAELTDNSSVASHASPISFLRVSDHPILSGPPPLRAPELPKAPSLIAPRPSTRRESVPIDRFQGIKDEQKNIRASEDRMPLCIPNWRYDPESPVKVSTIEYTVVQDGSGSVMYGLPEDGDESSILCDIPYNGNRGNGTPANQRLNFDVNSLPPQAGSSVDQAPPETMSAKLSRGIVTKFRTRRRSARKDSTSPTHSRSERAPTYQATIISAESSSTEIRDVLGDYPFGPDSMERMEPRESVRRKTNREQSPTPPFFRKR